MTMASLLASGNRFDLSRSTVHRNLPVAELIQHALQRGESELAASGALVSRTGKFTGRTPKDKAIVREPGSEANVWWGNNAEMSVETFEKLRRKAQAHLNERDVYVVDTFGGADPEHRIRVRFLVEKAWHALFVKQLLIRPDASQPAEFDPEWTILCLPTLQANPEEDGTRSEASIALNFAEKTVLILGTEYAGEMKKSVFTILNYLLPLKGVLSMHCSANVGPRGDTALFFGLSGTGKTTLSADPSRRLIGDDEHGWTDNGVFNFEGGCYAKCIKLSAESEPQIYGAIRFGSVLENVILKPDRTADFDSTALTENTRAAYPLEFIENALHPSLGGHPENIAFLTADAFGVLPPISRLTPEQAMFYFLNGYTAKVAGTETGVTEPQATFSTCFGAPFLPLHPMVYAELLREKIARHQSRVWLVNTGWTAGPYGVGHRMPLRYTRAMVDEAFAGSLDQVETIVDPIFGLEVPTSCPGVPSEVLLPWNTWADRKVYDVKARELQRLFEDNYAKFV